MPEAAAATSRGVGIGGLGAIGSHLAAALVAGELPGLRLAAVSARDRARAAERLALLGAEVPVVGLEELAERAEIVVEALPAAAFDAVALPAVERGRLLVVLSAGCLLERAGLIARARETGARILVPSGGILGLDGLRAAAGSGLNAVTFVTRKPPKSLAGAPYLVERGIDVMAFEEATCVFSGPVRAAVAAFPANVNVAAALSLAGFGPDRTTVEVWADPAAERVRHSVQVDSAASRFEVTVESVPNPGNPATSQLTPYSLVAALRRLCDPLTVGS